MILHVFLTAHLQDHRRILIALQLLAHDDPLHAAAVLLVLLAASLDQRIQVSAEAHIAAQIDVQGRRVGGEPEHRHIQGDVPVIHDLIQHIDNHLLHLTEFGCGPSGLIYAEQGMEIHNLYYVF